MWDFALNSAGCEDHHSDVPHWKAYHTLDEILLADCNHSSHSPCKCLIAQHRFHEFLTGCVIFFKNGPVKIMHTVKWKAWKYGSGEASLGVSTSLYIVFLLSQHSTCFPQTCRKWVTVATLCKGTSSMVELVPGFFIQVLKGRKKQMGRLYWHVDHQNCLKGWMTLLTVVGWEFHRRLLQISCNQHIGGRKLNADATTWNTNILKSFTLNWLPVHIASAHRVTTGNTDRQTLFLSLSPSPLRKQDEPFPQVAHCKMS